MKLKVLDLKNETAVFLIENINYSFANGLRRIFMNRVPTLAIEYVDFIENDSVISDEVLAHRLGLIPLTFGEKLFVTRDECKCNGKGCSNCQVELKMNKVGPCTVYSGDLISSEPSVKPVYDNIIICRLGSGMKLEFLAYASLGIGEKHPKWQASLTTYVNLVKNAENKKTKKCWTQDYNLYCVECFEDLKDVTVEKDKFLFYLESVSGLTAKRIIEDGLEYAKKYLNQLKKAI
ncbi:MAG: DNA-directed RNA polymerase subunit D [Candidatus Aenigmarchaeota archaeon]|nr:DNA-directed RNA polymerase subunit D [Candidatus Aenigmarchaeota archaeon]MDW8149420.1 DNA-directed RNA polymerase subunit D [Candidatus Aenigmarchaeota archaeon]